MQKFGWGLPGSVEASPIGQSCSILLGNVYMCTLRSDKFLQSGRKRAYSSCIKRASLSRPLDDSIEAFQRIAFIRRPEFRAEFAIEINL